jgi:hypothetical protein
VPVLWNLETLPESVNNPAGRWVAGKASAVNTDGVNGGDKFEQTASNSAQLKRL